VGWLVDEIYQLSLLKVYCLRPNFYSFFVRYDAIRYSQILTVPHFESYVLLLLRACGDVAAEFRLQVQNSKSTQATYRFISLKRFLINRPNISKLPVCTTISKREMAGTCANANVISALTTFPDLEQTTTLNWRVENLERCLNTNVNVKMHMAP